MFIVLGNHNSYNAVDELLEINRYSKGQAFTDITSSHPSYICSRNVHRTVPTCVENLKADDSWKAGGQELMSLKKKQKK